MRWSLFAVSALALTVLFAALPLPGAAALPLTRDHARTRAHDADARTRLHRRLQHSQSRLRGRSSADSTAKGTPGKLLLVLSNEQLDVDVKDLGSPATRGPWYALWKAAVDKAGKKLKSGSYALSDLVLEGEDYPVKATATLTKEHEPKHMKNWLVEQVLAFAPYLKDKPKGSVVEYNTFEDSHCVTALVAESKHYNKLPALYARCWSDADPKAHTGFYVANKGSHHDYYADWVHAGDKKSKHFDMSVFQDLYGSANGVFAAAGKIGLKQAHISDIATVEGASVSVESMWRYGIPFYSAKLLYFPTVLFRNNQKKLFALNEMAHTPLELLEKWLLAGGKLKEKDLSAQANVAAGKFLQLLRKTSKVLGDSNAKLHSLFDWLRSRDKQTQEEVTQFKTSRGKDIDPNSLEKSEKVFAAAWAGLTKALLTEWPEPNDAPFNGYTKSELTTRQEVGKWLHPDENYGGERALDVEPKKLILALKDASPLAATNWKPDEVIIY